MSVRIVHEYNHYVVYVNEKFFCSADTYTEAVKELEENKNV